MDPAELLSGLSRADAFPEAGPTVEVVQTHISIVFLTGSRAYKVKKTLALWGFLDYSTLEARRTLCEAEVRLNRRLAPETYLGVLPVVRREGRLFVGGEGEVVDHAVVMARLPAGATLAERIAAGRATVEDVRAIAALLRRFHAETAGGAESRRVGAPPTFEKIVRQNVDATKAAIPDVFPERVHRWLADRLDTLLRATRPVLGRRAAEGRIVEGHGDLRAEHCVLWGEGGADPSAWRVIDAIEFTPLLRCIDPLSDAAFLAMDLASLGRPDLSRAFTDAYLGPAPDADARALWPLFLAYRAHVRAKVDAQRATEGEIPPAARTQALAGARRHLALACGFAHRGLPPPLVVVAGPSGGGKSVVARALATSLDAVLLASDLVRKELAGLAPTARATGGALARLYAPELSARTYGELVSRAEDHLRAGRPVVLDATYLRRPYRAVARDLARRLGVPFALLWVDVPDDVARARIEARAREGADPSDATVEVRRAQRAEMEAPDATEADVLRLDGREPPEAHLLTLWERILR